MLDAFFSWYNSLTDSLIGSLALFAVGLVLLIKGHHCLCRAADRGGGGAERGAVCGAGSARGSLDPLGR